MATNLDWIEGLKALGEKVKETMKDEWYKLSELEEFTGSDAFFIAASSPGRILELISMVEEQRKEIEQLVGDLHAATEDYSNESKLRKAAEKEIKRLRAVYIDLATD